MTEIYRTTITEAGPLATSFISEGMFVTFGTDAPDALREFCFIVSPAKTTSTIEVGHRLVIDGHPFAITAIGEVAQHNLDALGHVTVNVDGASKSKLGGAIHIGAGANPPAPVVGSVLVIDAP